MYTKFQAFGNRKKNKQSVTNVQLQDVFMPILDATNLTELRKAVCDTLKHCLPNVERARVFLTNPESQQVEADGIILPQRGFAWDAFHQKSRQLCSVPFDPDPLIDLLALHSTDVQKVLLAPVPARRKDSNIGIIVASVTSVDLTASEDKYMELLLKQISVSYESMKLFVSEPATENSQLESLIALCADLHDQDAAQLELKVIKYHEDDQKNAEWKEESKFVHIQGAKQLREHTCSESGFLLLVVPETLELISQVVGSTILPEEVRFPGLWSCFAQALETKQPMFLEHIPQDRRAEVEKIVEKPVHSFLCVPVACKDSHELIALACLVNKANGQRFGDDDIQIVRQCFKYTATVLTSTLAFQNERKLKNQTQALLHVARKLFTRLGEFIDDDIQKTDSLTSINNITRCLHSLQFMLTPFEKDKKFLHSLFSNKESHGTNNSSVKQLDKTGGEYLGENWNVDAGKFFKSSASLHADTVSEKKIPCGSENIGLVKKSSVEALRSISFAESIYKELQALSTGTVDEHLKLHKGDTSVFLPETNSSSHMIKLSSTWNTKETSSREGSSTSLTTDFLGLGYHGSTFARRYSQNRSRRASCLAVSRKPIDVSAVRRGTLELVQQKNVAVASILYLFDPHVKEILQSTQEEIPLVLKKNLFGLQASHSFIHKEHEDITDDKLSLLNRSLLHNSIFSQEDPQRNTMSQRVIEGTPMGKEEGEKEILLSEANKDIIQQGISLASQASTDEAERKVGFKTVPTIHVASVDERRQSAEETASQTDVLPHEMKKYDSFIQEYGRQFSVLDSKGGGGSLTLQDLIDLQPPNAEYSDERFLHDLTKLLREIMQEARNLTDAERCSVFLLDQDSDELVATVFDGISTNNKEAQAEIRLPKTQGIAGHVATTGTLLNIKDAYSHPLFYRGIDDSTGFRTRNILCFPIKDEEGVVLGVAQLCNKKTGTYFTTFDEDIASAFAVYCCISISHSLMYKKVIDIQYRNSLANELMMFHMKCLIYKKLRDTQHRNKLANELMIFHMQQIPTEEVTELAGKKIPNIKKINPVFDQFVYPPRSLAETQTPLACMSMFDDLGLSTRWRLKRDTLARFLLMVKKGYRNPPYHNWMHAFAVGHFGYLCIKNLKLDDLLDDIELLAFIVSCLCHDIDHRGTTNSFQVKSQSVLAALYSSEGSVMERHHLAQSMCILNTEGSNIFENLTSKEYQQVLDLMRDIILATDLAHHLRIFDSLQTMATKGYNKNDPKCHNLLLCLLMTASDLSDQTKSWNNTKHIAVLIYQEFFSQGDLEKALGESPIEMMDRERACVPDLQISFLDNIAIPVYRVLAEVFPEAQCIADCVQENRQHWVRKAQLLKMHNSSAQTMSVQEIIALGEEEEEVGSHHENSR